MSVGRRWDLIEPEHPRLSITRQCELVSVSRSSYYGAAKDEPAVNLALMRRIDEQFLETPWYGSRQMTRHLRRHGHEVNRKRVRRLMARMGLQAVYQRPKTTLGSVRNTRFGRTCCATSPSTAPTKFGAPTSPTVRLVPDDPGCICLEC